MSTEELIRSTLENFLGSLPELFVLLLTLLYYLRSIGKKTDTFPNEVNVMKNNIINDFKLAKDGMVDAYKNAKNEIFDITSNAIDNIKKSVSKDLESMKTALNNYKDTITKYSEQLQISKMQTNSVVKQNIIYMDIIAQLVSQDPKMIKSGIATMITNNFNSTKEELLKYPELLVMDKEVFENAIKEQLFILGEEAFREMLERIGYNVEREIVEQPSTTTEENPNVQTK